MSQRGIAVVMETKLANLCQPIIGRNVWYLDRLRVLSLPAGFLICAPRRWAFCSFAQFRAVADRLIPVSLELGGKDPTVELRDDALVFKLFQKPRLDEHAAVPLQLPRKLP
jgi:hypothetical protein